MNNSNTKEWFPQKLMSNELPIALIVLNQPLNEDNKLFLKKHWKSALFRVAVDGGANRLKELGVIGEQAFIPELLCGDFDSIKPDVLEYYKSKGVRIVPTLDQDETDFTKALTLTEEYLNKKRIKVSSIVSMARNGERLDHIFGNLNTLFKAVEITSLPVFILGYNSLTWLLTVGYHEIHIDDKFENCHVGLIPIGTECNDVTTTGLKWNLTHGSMAFGGLVSTSNKFSTSSLVTVQTNSPLIFTMELKSVE